MISQSKGMILKTLLYHIVMSFFGIMLYTATKNIGFLCVIGQATALFFYAYILFDQASGYGYKAAEAAHRNGEGSAPFAGLILAFLAFIPVIAISLAAFILKVSASDIGNTLFVVEKLLVQGLFTGIAQWLYPTSATMTQNEILSAMDSQTLVFFLASFPGILISGAGYFIGNKKFDR